MKMKTVIHRMNSNTQDDVGKAHLFTKIVIYSVFEFKKCKKDYNMMVRAKFHHVRTSNMSTTIQKRFQIKKSMIFKFVRQNHKSKCAKKHIKNKAFLSGYTDCNNC